jgi:NADPH2:quinone reductase
VITDAIGGQISRQGFDLLAPFGRAVLYGAASGELADVPFRSLVAMKYVVGFSLLAWRAARPAQARQEMTEVAAHAEAGRLRTGLHATFPLTQAASAHQLLEDRAQFGRVLLTP